MSVLSGENQSPTPTDQTNDYVKQVVETKGEQFADIQVLAKSKIAADEHIQKLEAENTRLKEEQSKQDYTKELLAKFEEGNAPSHGVQEPENTTPKFDEEQLKSLIQSQLSENQKAQIENSNLLKADEKLTAIFGNEAEAVVEKRGQELGFTKDMFRDIAAKSPDAFMALMGQEPVKEQSPTVPQGKINTTAASFSGANVRNNAYYQNMRRENSKQYFSPTIQKQLLEDRVALGDKFYQ